MNVERKLKTMSPKKREIKPLNLELSDEIKRYIGLAEYYNKLVYDLYLLEIKKYNIN
jgi:hypothetical protein